ncbi:hypothetical protein MRB53_031565 [Persea americana]|uniref:Uncharacterized protein n=1 Tax=Persea americana TaxID=3435 RepID=A0ACC2KPC3_PERAE|nr:hypothetical protein MRB53_031565 [Persea americana]
MEGSSKVFSAILMRIVFLLLFALIISPAESVNIAHDHPQTGGRDGDPQDVTVTRGPGLRPPAPRASNAPDPPALNR